MALRSGKKVYSQWSSGNLVFKDSSGNEIMTIDGANRKVSLPSGSDLDVAAGLLARSALTEDALQPYDVMDRVLGADGAALGVSETAGDFFRNIGTNQMLIDGEATVNETEASVGWFTFTLPPEYVSSGDIKIRAGAGIVLAGDAALTSATIDFEAYLQATDGTVGSDLVSTAATAITDTFGNKDFVVTATGLVAGDHLVIKMTTSVVETAGGTGAANSRITRLQMLCDIKG